MPENNQVYGRHKGQGLVLIGVHIDPDVKQRNAIVKQKGVNYPVCEDKFPNKPTGVAATYHIEYIPTIYVIDRKGKIIAVEPPNLEEAVKKALGK
jgi:hypothetical protein